MHTSFFYVHGIDIGKQQRTAEIFDGCFLQKADIKRCVMEYKHGTLHVLDKQHQHRGHTGCTRQIAIQQAVNFTALPRPSIRMNELMPGTGINHAPMLDHHPAQAEQLAGFYIQATHLKVQHHKTRVCEQLRSLD